ncbi:MAG: phospholipase D-like domain-containing protein [Bdellovibrionota bacterium]|nr:phospholipase D-like domain-containing protein [Bdellovibrionota bacterium]
MTLLGNRMSKILLVTALLFTGIIYSQSSFASLIRVYGNYGLPLDKAQHPMRLPVAPEKSEDAPFKYSTKIYSWFEDIVATPLEESLDPRMKSLLLSRQFKSWFYYQDSILRDLSIDTKPIEVGIKRVKTPQEGLLAKLALIDSAKYTIDISYYIFKKDETGYALLEGIRRAISRGVNVRIVVDGIGSLGLYHSELKALKKYANDLQKAGGKEGRIRDEKGNLTDQYAMVEALVFNRVIKLGQSFRKAARKVGNLYRDITGNEEEIPEINSWFNRRSHDKVLLVDGRFPGLAKAIFGGRNISNSYYGIPKVDSDTYMDQEVVVKNLPDLALAQEEFDFGKVVSDWYEKLYFFQGNHYLYVGIASVGGYNSEYENMTSSYKYIDQVTKGTQEDLKIDINQHGFGEAYLASGWLEGSADLVYSIHNLYRRNASSGKDIEENARNHDELSEVNGIIKTIRDHLWKEDERIAIISPYLWLSDEEISALKRWLEENPDRYLDIYTNSVLTSDNMLAQALVDQALGPGLLEDRKFEDRIRIFQYGKLDAIELGGKGVYGKLHQKGVMFYGQNLAFEGTNNKDPRSQYLNSEVGVVLHSPDYVNQQVIPKIEKLRSESHLWNSDEYYKIREHEMLPKLKKKVIKNQKALYDKLIDYNLWWLI